jgi:hypothetical protein
MIQNRQARFWILGLGLLGGNGLYAGYKLVKLHESLTTPEMVFHGLIFLVAITLFDMETGKYVFDKVVSLLAFWKKNGNPPPPPAEG